MLMLLLMMVFRRVGAWGDRTDDAKRRVFKEHHAAVTGQRGGGEIFYARRVVQRSLVFEKFIFLLPIPVSLALSSARGASSGVSS